MLDKLKVLPTEPDSIKKKNTDSNLRKQKRQTPGLKSLVYDRCIRLFQIHTSKVQTLISSESIFNQLSFQTQTLIFLLTKIIDGKALEHTGRVADE